MIILTYPTKKPSKVFTVVASLYTCSFYLQRHRFKLIFSILLILILSVLQVDSK